MSATFGALVLASLFAAEPVTGPRATREVEAVLAQPRFRFCDPDSGYIPAPEDQRWCEFAAEVGEACPGLAKVCDLTLGSEIYGRPEGASESSGPEGEGHANPMAGQDSKPAEISDESALPDLGGFAQVLVWLLLGGILVGVLVAVLRNRVRGGDEDEGELDLGEPDPRDSLIAARVEARRVIETDVRRLLAQAEDEARKGAHDEAIAKVYAALLRRLEGDGLIGVDRWKTNGDYLRALASRPELRAELRAVIREVEPVQFGEAPRATLAERYASIRAKVLAVVGRASLVALLGLGLGTQGACDEPEPVAADPLSLAGLGDGPGGQRAVAELLRAFGIEARFRSQSIEQLARTHGAIVLLSDVTLSEVDWDRLVGWVEDDGGILILATGREFPRRLGVDYVGGPEGELSLERVSADLGALELGAPSGRVLAARSLIETDDLVLRPAPELDEDLDQGWGTQTQTQADPYILRRDLGEGQVVFFAETDLLDNASLLVRDNAALLVNLLRSLEVDELEFVNARTGAGADDPFESVRNARLGPLFIQLLLFLALLYAAVGIPFARLRDPPKRRRRAFAEHVETLGQRYAQARAARFVAAHYCSWALERLRERHARTTGGGLFPLAQAIAARTGHDAREVMRILVEAQDVQTDDGSRGGPAELTLMRQLAELLARSTHPQHPPQPK